MSIYTEYGVKSVTTNFIEVFHWFIEQVMYNNIKIILPTNLLLLLLLLGTETFAFIPKSRGAWKVPISLNPTCLPPLATTKVDPVSFRSSKFDLFSSSSSTEETSTLVLATRDEIIKYAESVGVALSLSTLGPGYRAVARASHDPKQILGYCEGFIRPAGKILHVDKLEVWKKALERAKKENPVGFQNGGQVFGVSLLLGYITMLHGKENNCSIAEFLAIDDEDFQHKRLVRFFKRAGFVKIRYVGDDIRNIPDRLIWGGCGTLMNCNIESILKRWTVVLFHTSGRRETELVTENDFEDL